jgi:hypothetical protein
MLSVDVCGQVGSLVVWEGVERIHLFEDTDQWLAVVYWMLNFQFVQKVGNFLTSRTIGKGK